MLKTTLVQQNRHPLFFLCAAYVCLLSLAAKTPRPTRVSQDAVTAQQKENAAPVKTKLSAGPTKKQLTSGKENDTHAVPRKTRTTASSGGSPRLLKKALGQISLNSPRVNQRLVISSHTHKPIFSPAAAPVAESTLTKPPTAATQDGPTSEAVTIDTATRGSDNKIEEENTSTVVEEAKADARDESASAASQPLAVEVGQEGESAVAVATDVVQGRPSMMVATANPRLQETSALPRGTVVRARLFAEETAVPEVTQEEKVTAVAESADEEETEQQQQQDEERPESVQLPHQEQGKKTGVVDACAHDVVSPGSVTVAPEPAAAGEQQVETPVLSQLPETEQNKDGQQQCCQWQEQAGETAAPVSEEVRRDACEASVTAGSGADMPVDLHEGEHVLEVEETDASTPEPETAASVVEENDAGEGVGQALSSPAQLEMETTLTAVLPSSPKEGGEKEDQPRVSPSQQPAEEAVVTEKPHELTEEAIAAEHELGVGDEYGEGKGAAVVIPHHTGLVVDAETRSLVEESKYLRFADDERSVLCTLTGKKITPAYDNILLYMGSRKVQRLMVEGPFFMTVSTSN